MTILSECNRKPHAVQTPLEVGARGRGSGLSILDNYLEWKLDNCLVPKQDKSSYLPYPPMLITLPVCVSCAVSSVSRFQAQTSLDLPPPSAVIEKTM